MSSCFTIGELPSTPVLENILSYISSDAKALSCTILFDLMELDHTDGRYPLMALPWKLSDFKRLTAFGQQLAEPHHAAHALSYLENHDQARSVSRFASDAPEHRRFLRHANELSPSLTEWLFQAWPRRNFWRRTFSLYRGRSSSIKVKKLA